MSGEEPPVHITVRGGSHGVEADCNGLRTLAGRFGDAALDAFHATSSLNGFLIDPALLPAAAIDPGGAVSFEVALGLALDGPTGLAACAACAGAADAALRAAARAYEAVDAAERIAINDLDAVTHLPRVIVHSGTDVWHGRFVQALQDPVTDDPQLLDVAQQIPGLAAAETLLTAIAASEDGTPLLHNLGPATDIVGAVPPRGVADLLRDVEARNEGPHGDIDVRILTDATGRRTVIVDITGTKSWLPHNADITNLDTNLLSLDGVPTSYEQGVLDAMAQAGVGRDDPVMIVGHSQGGMVAVEVARDAVESGRFNVTHVVTAGSPIGRSVGAVPASVQVLALENDSDLVPHLDGLPNPDRTNVTTVTGRITEVDDDEGEGRQHSILKSYVPIGEAIDASAEPSVRDFLDTAAQYFEGTSVLTRTYNLTRAGD